MLQFSAAFHIHTKDARVQCGRQPLLTSSPIHEHHDHTVHGYIRLYILTRKHLFISTLFTDYQGRLLI